MFHIPAHKASGPSQYREQRPSRQTDENSKQFPTTPREPKPLA